MVVGVQETKGYGLGFGIPTILFAVAIAAFVLGAVFKLYTRVPPEGSPFTRMFGVLRGEGWWWLMPQHAWRAAGMAHGAVRSHRRCCYRCVAAPLSLLRSCLCTPQAARCAA